MLNLQDLTALLRDSAIEATELLDDFGRGPFPRILIVADYLEENGDSRGPLVRRLVARSDCDRIEFKLTGAVTETPLLPRQCLYDILRLFRDDVCLCDPPPAHVFSGNERAARWERHRTAQR